MQVRFVAQPFDDGSDMREFVDAVCADESLEHFEIVVAWAKRSGLKVVEDDLRILRARGCSLRLIVGIDQGGATRQGLELAKDLFDEVSVFHDRGGRTFHPKVYVAWGEGSGRVLVGSHNLTAGGAHFNYEAAIELTLSRPADDELLATLRDFTARLRSDTGMCQVLTAGVLSELISNPRYKIGDENLRHNPGIPGVPADLDTETDVESITEPTPNPPSIFGPSALLKKPAPAASKGGAPKKTGVPGPQQGAGESTLPVVNPTDAATGTVVKRWFKKLPNSDAQQPQTGNATGALRLTMSKHPIDWRTYFRQTFFSDQNWQNTVSQHGETLDYANVDFDVVINGASIGAKTLRIDHAPHREQGQSNVPTDLKWGVLSSNLLANDFTGSYVVLERLSNGAYRLEITPSDPGRAAFLA